jgi:hypothetical protein
MLITCVYTTHARNVQRCTPMSDISLLLSDSAHHEDRSPVAQAGCGSGHRLTKANYSSRWRDRQTICVTCRLVSCCAHCSNRHSTCPGGWIRGPILHLARLPVGFWLRLVDRKKAKAETGVILSRYLRLHLYRPLYKGSGGMRIARHGWAQADTNRQVAS